MPLKEKEDETLAEAKKSLARLREKRYYVRTDLEMKRFNIKQECRRKLHDLEEQYRKWFRALDAEIATVQDIVNFRNRGPSR